VRGNLIANQLWTLRLTPICTLPQKILLTAHNPVTGNPVNLKSLTSEPSPESSPDTTTSPPPTPQTPDMSGSAPTVVPAIHVSITHMPTHGHLTAPRFNVNALNLYLYFDEVESLSTDAGLNKEGKIWHALCYASHEDNELWSTLPEAEAQLPDYVKFCNTIIKLYPGADDERKYVESNLEWLINTQRQYRIGSRAKLGHYYREFHHISKFLIDKWHLSDIEQNKMYMRGFDEKLQEYVKGRLQVKFLDHYYDDLYEWQDFHECTHFLLAGTTAKSSVGTVTQAHIHAIFAIPPTLSAPPPAAVVVKMEDTMSILQDTLQRMESMFASTIYQNTQGAP
jgi:hypothetical protein